MCTKILSTEEEQYACHVGCTKLVAQQFKEDGLFTISITRENLFPIKELFKNFLWGKDNSVEQEREIEVHSQLELKDSFLSSFAFCPIVFFFGVNIVVAYLFTEAVFSECSR